jgi:superfamily II DNA or RNA helicase
MNCSRSLRSHQAATLQIADSIAAGAPIRRIYASVTPGGGKSALPGILADRLIPKIADRILWVVPRNTLREQGEGDFPDWSRYRIRAAGNEADPCRGTQGYVTTYQAIVADPARHLKTLASDRWILFLDEPHHRMAGGPWDSAIAPLVARAALVVYASGTFARGDGQPIAGIEYDGEGLPVFEGPGRACVRYSRRDALREGAIIPVHFKHLDGRAEWEDEDGAIRQAESLSGGDYAPAALFTALRTGYALELLDETVADWLEYRRAVYPVGKLLVVAPNIETAGVYLEHLRGRGIDALIATSDDSPQAAQAIARYKGRALPSADALVTVAMAYEGMSVPAVSHIACLTHIRSVPWLEQCFARGNRTAPGKREAFIFAPADKRIRAAIASIEAEQVLGLADAQKAREGAEAGEFAGVGGGGRPSIRPIGSAAYREGPELDFSNVIRVDTDQPRPDGGLGPHAAEKLLRSEIHKHIETYLGKVNYGSKAARQRILMRKLKDLVGGKAREDCTTEELTLQFAWLKDNARIGGGK